MKVACASAMVAFVVLLCVLVGPALAQDSTGIPVAADTMSQVAPEEAPEGITAADFTIAAAASVGEKD